MRIEPPPSLAWATGTTGAATGAAAPPGEPPELAAVTRNVINLYEMPTLFYAGTAFAFAAGATGTALVTLGWAYVTLRGLHSAIHVTTNKVRWRFRVFAASWFVLIAYWVVLGATLARSAAAAGAAG